MKVTANAELCRDCQCCALGCSLYHDSVCSPARARLTVAKDMARFEFAIHVCHQCQDPDCVAACVAGAMKVNEQGVAIVDEGSCVRCGACADACPFEAIFYHAPTERYLKCDLCAGRSEGPLCVQLCPAGALNLVEGSL